ncbi:MAG: TonB-dependent receptor, partial [Algoriphagus sp.]|nr:TonB-dependent receptor [Algoriphagus sp.]
MKHVFTLLFLLFSLELFAQIQLKITDQITGLPLENVRVKADRSIQRTNASGMVAFPGENLKISFALEGYETLEKTFSTGEFEVQLIPTVLNLSAVTVTAFESE